MDRGARTARMSNRRRLQRLEVIYAAIGVCATFPATALVARVVAGPAFHRYGFITWTVPGLLALTGAAVDVRYAGPLGRVGRFILYAAVAVQLMATLFYSPLGSIVYMPAALLAFASCRYAHRASRLPGIDK